MSDKYLYKRQTAFKHDMHPGIPTLRSVEKDLALRQGAPRNVQASRVEGCLEGLQILPRRPLVAHIFRLSFPLKLGIGSPRVDAQVVLFMTVRLLILSKLFVEISRTAELLGPVALFEREQLAIAL